MKLSNGVLPIGAKYGVVMALIMAAPATAFAEQRVLYAENFESGAATGWLLTGRVRTRLLSTRATIR